MRSWGPKHKQRLPRLLPQGLKVINQTNKLLNNACAVLCLDKHTFLRTPGGWARTWKSGLGAGRGGGSGVTLPAASCPSFPPFPQRGLRFRCGHSSLCVRTLSTPLPAATSLPPSGRRGTPHRQLGPLAGGRTQEMDGAMEQGRPGAQGCRPQI